jgi:hypothetical protein
MIEAMTVNHDTTGVNRSSVAHDSFVRSNFWYQKRVSPVAHLIIGLHISIHASHVRCHKLKGIDVLMVWVLYDPLQGAFYN